MVSSSKERIRATALVFGATVATMFCASAGAFADLFTASRSLQVGALVDFVDDALGNPNLTIANVNDMMAKLKTAGVSDVSWGYYADAQGGQLMPNTGWTGNVRTVYSRLGNPLAEAVRAGHDQNLEVFGYFKPYEMGVDLVYPEGSPEAAQYGIYERIGGKLAWADPYMATHPELCIQHRSVTLPEPENDNPISTIKLYKSNNDATRLGAGNLQIWTSPNNYQYQQQSVSFQFQETTEIAAEDVRDINNTLITRAGDPVRVLTLSGLNLADPYVLVTTDFTSGGGDFVNAATHMLRAYDAGGATIGGVYSNGSAIYNADQANFRTWGLMYDHGYGLRTGSLDTSNASGKTGLIAFTRGKAEHLGAPCETEPLVRQYWLDQVRAILDTGADGVEFRIENHSTHTDFPEEYGYNQVVLNLLDDPAHPTTAGIAQARGDAYTDFLIAAKQMIESRGKKMRINFELDKLSGSLPPNRNLAYPANMEIQWQRWVDLDLPDEAVFRSYGIPFSQILANPTTNAIADALHAKGIPLYYNQYVNQTGNIQGDIETIRNDARFDGFVFYETADYLSYNADGTTSFSNANISAAMTFAAQPPAGSDDATISMLAEMGEHGWKEVTTGSASWSIGDESEYGEPENGVSPSPDYVAHGNIPTGDRGYIYRELSAQEEADALAKGWKITMRARFYQDWNAGFSPDGPDHDVGFGVKTSQGDVIVGHKTQRATTSGPWGLTVALFGSDDEGNPDRVATPAMGEPETLFPTYMDYTLSYDPVTRMATLTVTDARTFDDTSHTLVNSMSPTTALWDGLGSENENMLSAAIYVGYSAGAVAGGHVYIDSLCFEINAPMPGDANDDGRVDDADASILGAHWLTQGGAIWAMGDFNTDGKVNDADAAILAAHWHQAAPGTLPGDANVDGTVDDKDASILGSHWRAAGGWLDGDFNGDHNVDDRDAAILAAHWGDGASEAAAPEPGTLALLLTALGSLIVRRRLRKAAMAFGVGVAVAFCAAANAPAAADDARPETHHGVTAPVDDVRLGGMWGAAQARAASRLAMAPLNRTDFILADLSLKMKRRYTEYSGDVSGRWIGAAAFLAPLYPRPFAPLPQIMAAIPTYQKSDGHFGADQDLPRIEHDRDTAILWGNGRLLIGLVEVHERTGDRKALETAEKLGDYFIAIGPVFNKPEIIARKPGGYNVNFETYYLSCIEGLAALGRVTGKARYLDEGKRIGELAMTVTNFDNIHSHGRLCAVRGFAELFNATGDTRWRDAAERDWKTFMDKYRLPTGGVKEVLDPGCDRDEGCSECDWLRLNLALWRLTGKGCYLDESERCLRGHFIYNQYPNGGAGHRVLHQIDGQPVAFAGAGDEAWWCCSEHWPRATADVARLAVTGGEQGPSINLMIDCAGTVAGPGGKWRIDQRETADGLRVTLQSPTETKAAVRIHRPAWARDGARIETPADLSLRETDEAWFVEGTWKGDQTVVVHLPTALRGEAAPGGAGVLLRGHDLMVAHRCPANAWLMDTLPGARPVVRWTAATAAGNGRVQAPASLKADADPQRPEQWKPLELAPLRAVAGEPHEAAWFSFQLLPR